MLLDAITRAIRALGRDAALEHGSRLRVLTDDGRYPHLRAHTLHELAPLLLAELRLRPRFDAEHAAIHELRYALDVREARRGN